MRRRLIDLKKKKPVKKKSVNKKKSVKEKPVKREIIKPVKETPTCNGDCFNCKYDDCIVNNYSSIETNIGRERRDDATTSYRTVTLCIKANGYTKEMGGILL